MTTLARVVRYRARKLRKWFGVRRVLAAMAILFTGAAIYTSLLFEQRQDALSRASRYDLSWTAAQTANELSRLGQTLAIYGQRNGLASLRDVELRYELFLSRISLFDSPTFRSFAQEDPRNAQIITEMRASADTIGQLIDHLDEPGNLEKATRIFLDLNPKAAVLASAANHSGAAKVFEDYRGLLRLHYVYSAVTFTLVASGLILLWSLSRQNDLLNQTRMIAERAQAQAESGSQAKTEFLAAMSHEIRTPLHGILGFTDLILDRNDLTADLRRYAERIRTSGSALLTVVNDVLDFSKIEAGAVDLNPRPFPLKAMIANCDSIMRKLAEANGLMLTVKVAESLPARVVGDEARIRQVLLNLLNNAIKFTPAGNVDLKVEEDRGHGAMRFTVRDTGVGIPFDKQDRLFQRFSQVDSSATRQYGGTGLGLAISKRLVELMGGTIDFESMEGRGSSFWFTVPLVPASDEEIESLETRARPAREGKARVLVAEDVEINQEIAKAVLEGSGYEVDVVADGVEAARAAEARPYDLILMDIQMPTLDGIAATRRIRDGNGPCQGVPIVALTANVYREQIAKFLAMGMNDHLGKPFKRDELLHKVESWLSKRRLPEGGGPAAELPPEPQPRPEAAPEAYHDLLETVGPEVASRLLSRLSQILSAFPGRIGTEEERAVAARAAHSIVSAAGQLGFEDLSDACRHLENAYRSGGDMAAAMQRVDQVRHATLRRIAGLRSAA